jgi:peptidoglycan/LPS O-acetylase OafA/YrhL
VIVVCLWLRVWNWQSRESYALATHVYPTHLRFDALFLGVALAYWYYTHRAVFEKLRRWRYALLALGVLSFTPAFVAPLEHSPLMNTVGFSLLSLGASLLLIGALLSSPEDALSKRLARVGAKTYSIYLWHVPVLAWVTPAVLATISSPPLWLTFAVYLIGSYVIGSEMARMVEFPALKLRDRWFPRKAPALAAG